MEALFIFWIWWRDQLLDLVPGYAARRRSQQDDGLVLSEPLLMDGPEEPSSTGVASVLVAERRNGSEQPLGRIALEREALDGIRGGASRNHLPIVLRVPDTLLLERDVALPIAAERELGRVLFHEMDRYTPFSGGEVLWTYMIRLRDRARGKLTIRLSLIHKAAVGPLVDTIGRAGIALAGIEVEGPDGQNRRIPLARVREAPARQQGLVRPLALASVALLIVAVGLPFVLQGQARADVERRIAASAPVVTRVQRLRHQANATATGSDVVAAERRRSGDALEAIALLTDALPDDTYLTALTFDTGKLTLDGQSKSAAALIAPLTASRRLQDASFTAPVIRNTLGMDTFSMRLRVTR